MGDGVMEMYYYIDQQNHQCGPIPYSSLANYGITADTYVWKAGMRDWEKARNLPELQSLCMPIHRDSIPQPQYRAQPMAVRANYYGMGGMRNSFTGGNGGGVRRFLMNMLTYKVRRLVYGCFAVGAGYCFSMWGMHDLNASHVGYALGGIAFIIVMLLLRYVSRRFGSNY